MLDDVQTGRIEQIGISLIGDAELEIISDGTAEIIARATASAASGLAQASASINDAILQAGSAPGNVALQLLNQGKLLIDALANAEGSETGAAHALANVDTAIGQWANSTEHGVASIALINEGDLRVAATAVATGIAAGATASGASVAAFARLKGISQLAMARAVDTFSGTTSAGNFVTFRSDAPIGPATVRQTNSDSIVMVADASAQATEFGLARATLTAVQQRAEGTDAAAEVANSGTIDIAASVAASGSQYALAGAFADGFHQTATALGTLVQHASTPLGGQTNLFVRLPAGDASVALENSGEIDISAVAHAVGSGADPDGATGVGAVAGAYVSAVLQSVVGTDASAVVRNSGSFSADASAVATGKDLAAAQVAAIGIRQAAAATGYSSFYAVGPTGTPVSSYFALYAVGPANLAVENSGAIDISARAKAVADGPVQVDATATGLWQAARGLASHLSVDNSGTFDVSALGQATGTSADAFVRAGGFIQQGAIALEAASANIDNSGELDVNAIASASGQAAIATAIAVGASQTAAAVHEASASFLNSGHFSVAATADVDGDFLAGAGVLAIGAQQQASAGEVRLGMENAGDLTATAQVNVAAVADSGFAYGSAGVFGLGQFATGSGVMESIANMATIYVDVDVAALADVTGVALASAIGAQQRAVGSDVQVNFENSGELTVSARVNAATEGGSGTAFANAVAVGAIQDGSGTAIGESLTNGGTISVGLDAAAKAIGADGNAAVLASAVGAQQQAVGAHIVSVDNKGELNVAVDVNAAAEGESGFAYGSAGAVGVGQTAFGALAKAALINSETINVDIDVVASATTADGIAVAFARGTGVHQSNHATTAFHALTNSGGINVEAAASATALARTATAVAAGYRAVGSGDVPMLLSLRNSGAIDVNAVAMAAGAADDPTMPHVSNGPFDAGSAVAAAWGIYVSKVPSFPDVAHPVNGTLTNSGSINVVASAAGESITTVIGTGTTATTVTVGKSSAFATGVLLFGGVNNMTISNSGAISVDAITADDGLTRAMGIAVLANGSVDPTPMDVLTINNSGDIIVRESIDGGETWRRGLAINVAGNPDAFVPGAPNKTVINLFGGRIYGHIAIQGGDFIHVQNNETALDGIINPACAPAGFTNGGSPPPGPRGVGTLVINNGGTLFLDDPRFPSRSNMYDGPSHAFVETLEMRAGKGGTTGTIAFALQPETPGVQLTGSYPQLFANTANVDGTLEVRLGSRTRLFADSYFWDNVIDANSLSGSFDSCVIGGAPGRSVLLGKLTCIYDDTNNVDLSLTRIRFDKVAGVSRNARAVGAQLERIYARQLATGIATLVDDLFLIADVDQYNQMLSSLAGEGYADYLQSFQSLGLRYNDLAIEATSCGVAAPIGVKPECRGPNPIRFWSRFDNHSHTAGRDPASGISARRFTSIFGVDAKVSDASIVGFSVGQVGNDIREYVTGEQMNAAGWQVGGYAAIDPGAWYARGVATFSRFDGDSRRNVDLARVGGIFVSALGGDPNVSMWTLGLQAGARISLGGSSVVTPYVNLDHVEARLAGFSEASSWGNGAAELRLMGGRARATYLTAGARWWTRVGGLVPEASLGYRYRFGDLRSNITAAFLGDESNAFDVVSRAEKPGALLAGLKVGGKLGAIDLQFGYEGEFRSNIMNHAGNFRVVLPFGTRAARPTPPR